MLVFIFQTLSRLALLADQAPQLVVHFHVQKLSFTIQCGYTLPEILLTCLQDQGISVCVVQLINFGCCPVLKFWLKAVDCLLFQSAAVNRLQFPGCPIPLLMGKGTHLGSARYAGSWLCYPSMLWKFKLMPQTAAASAQEFLYLEILRLRFHSLAVSTACPSDNYSAAINIS